MIVTGGRDFGARAFLFEALDGLHREHPITLLRHGDARGADRLADQWAYLRGVPRDPMPAEWERYRDRKPNPAGPIRNAAMLARSPVDLVIAFEGGSGTADMVRQALAAGVKVADLRVAAIQRGLFG